MDKRGKEIKGCNLRVNQILGLHAYKKYGTKWVKIPNDKF